MDKLKLEQVDKDEWSFVWPKSSDKATDLFFEALDYTDEGNIAKARQLLNKAVDIFPQHIDAIIHLGMMSSKKDAREMNEKAFQIGLSVLPKEFNEKSKLEWGWTENRPFLRACHMQGLALLNDKKLDEAIKLFNKMITWNPNDNQGIRDILSDIYVNNNMANEMITLSEKYPSDYSPSMNFGLAFALYKKGDKEKAIASLKKAINNFPLCGKILLEKDPKRPKSDMPGYITMGGPDQAYEFWKEQGKAWKEEDVRRWLESAFN